MKKVIFVFLNSVLLFANNISVNIFGFTHHFYKAKINNSLKLSNSNSINPGIGVNYFFKKDIYTTIDYLKNCNSENTFYVGVMKRFSKGKFFLDIGGGFIKSKYDGKKYSRASLMYDFGLRVNNKWSISFIFLPKPLTVEKKGNFIFTFLTFSF